MAILLGTSGGTHAAPSRIRQWLAKILSVAAVTGCSVSDASPLVVTKTGNGFSHGDIVVGIGAVNNPNAEGLNQVFYVTANTFKLVPLGSTLIAGNCINGGGASADSSVKFQRVYVALLPHDLLNMQTTLSRMSYVKDSDAADPTYPNESTVAALFGTATL